MSATDPTPLYRLRDGVYAADLLMVARRASSASNAATSRATAVLGYKPR